MSIAVVQIRPQPHYRRDAFENGLRRVGYRIVSQYEAQTTRLLPTDLLVSWNRSDSATQWEQAGGSVLIAENGYIGADAEGVQLYALALRGHNGSGRWASGGPQRWDALGIEVKPWRAHGEHIIIRAQRGIGPPDMASPPQWHVTASGNLRQLYPARRQVIQQHPGKPACDPQVSAEIIAALRGAWAMCIWSSAAGVRALVEGVPVFYAAPHWICEGAAVSGVGNLERPLLDDAARLQALRRLAWAQWSVAELASGEPFARLREEIDA